jgi:ureidoglycolate lyase
MKHLIAEPLTAAAYAPFGHVIAAPSEATGALANQGSARRFDRLVPMENLRGERAPLNVCLFRCAPRTMPFEIAILEKHPRSTQVFVPTSGHPYLVVVALGADAPDLSTLAVFRATGAQGISYAPGVWHHPLIALDATSDFLCLVHESDDAEDCVTKVIPSFERVSVAPNRA